MSDDTEALKIETSILYFPDGSGPNFKMTVDSAGDIWIKQGGDTLVVDHEDWDKLVATIGLMRDAHAEMMRSRERLELGKPKPEKALPTSRVGSIKVETP